MAGIGTRYERVVGHSVQKRSSEQSVVRRLGKSLNTIKRVSLKPVGCIVFDEELNAVCITRTFICACWLSRDCSDRCEGVLKFAVCLFLARQPPSGPVPPHSRGLQITHNDAPQSVGLLWTSDRLVAEREHTTLTTDHPCPRWDSNPQLQHASGRRPTPQTAWPLRLAQSAVEGYFFITRFFYNAKSYKKASVALQQNWQLTEKALRGEKQGK